MTHCLGVKLKFAVGLKGDCDRSSETIQQIFDLVVSAVVKAAHLDEPGDVSRDFVVGVHLVNI